jgi:hypothetical protein
MWTIEVWVAALCYVEACGAPGCGPTRRPAGLLRARTIAASLRLSGAARSQWVNGHPLDERGDHAYNMIRCTCLKGRLSDTQAKAAIHLHWES